MPATQLIEVTVAAGQVSGDTGRIPVALGSPVMLVVTSDVADGMARRARASDQLPLVVVMVLYTVGGLGLLFGF